MDVVRRRGHEEDDGAGEVGRLAPATGGKAGEDLGVPLGGVAPEGRGELGAEVPGAIAFTLTPRAHSFASAFVSCATPPLLAAYAETFSPPEKLSIEATVTIFPLSWATIRLPARRQSSKTDVRFVATTASHSANVCSSAGARRVAPWAVTRTSSPPSSATARSNAASRSPASARSAGPRRRRARAPRPPPARSAPRAPPSRPPRPEPGPSHARDRVRLRSRAHDVR